MTHTVEDVHWVLLVAKIVVFSLKPVDFLQFRLGKR